ncbi:MAG: glycosyltransferase family 4 protein [Chthoniobacteraceae bacterium]
MELSGANILMANLLDQFQRTGIETEWILTGHNPIDDYAWMGPRLFSVHRLPPTPILAICERQALMLEHLREMSPCVYLPNFDFDMACIAPALPEETAVVMIMHCDDPVYYDFVACYGQLFNAIVCVSQFVTNKLRNGHPHLTKRIVHIPFGVDAPVDLPLRHNKCDRYLNIVYCGRLTFHQKRIQDLAAIIRQCHDAHLPVRFLIAGTGADEKAFCESIAESLADGFVRHLGLVENTEVLNILDKADVLLITSDFEGLPIVLLEAMSKGCIPIASKAESGIDEVVQDGENGFLVPIGDVPSFIEALIRLIGDPSLLARLRQAAFARICSGGFTVQRAAADYLGLFNSLPICVRKVPIVRNGVPIVPSQYKISTRIVNKVKALLKVS